MVEASARGSEDTRAWMGRVAEGHEADHEAFVTWLNSAEAQEVFRRRRLTEYVLLQEGERVTVVFRAPHTRDPRIMIDFLRYPGMWPEFWQFERGGGPAEEQAARAAGATERVRWRRED